MYYSITEKSLSVKLTNDAITPEHTITCLVYAMTRLDIFLYAMQVI